MEIHHKSKPWHGWREFLREYLIVVAGVLTALGAGEVVDGLRWRHQVEAAEERLATEVRANLQGAYIRLVNQRCYDTRLTNLRNQLLTTGPWRGAAIQRTAVPGELAPAYMRAGILTSASPPVYITPATGWPDSSWTASLSNGVALHMRQDRADAYSQLYGGFAAMRDLQSAESDAASKLSALAFDRNVGDAERAHFLESVGQLSFMNVQMASLARGEIDAASASGIRLKKSDVAKIIDRERHWFLLRDCLEPVSIPVAPD
jgi:hypothetical protein